jgi:hypothetical protein
MALPLMLRCRLTPSQGASSLSLNSGTINLVFSPKQELHNRMKVVFEGENLKQGSYTLPYLFQSVDTANVAEELRSELRTLNYKLSMCDSELTNALKYTDSFGLLGSHPNYPPFPLCRNKTSARQSTPKNTFPSVHNPTSASEGYPLLYERDLAENPKPDPNQPQWVTDGWTASITVPTSDALVKTVSSGTM